MHQSAHQNYLETQVRTATPQKLQLMLLEGAMRFGRLAVANWSDPLPLATLEQLERCRQIVGHLGANIDPEASPVAAQAAAIYRFVFRLLCEAQILRDPERIEQANRVLESERETWQLVCQQMPEAPIRSHSGTTEITAPAPLPEEQPGFSLDA